MIKISKEFNHGKNKNKLILTSYGLTTPVGRKLIRKELANDNLQNKKIFLFHEPHYHIESMLIEACISMGFMKDNIILSGSQKDNTEVSECDYFYVTEGNTFEVLSLLRERGLDKVIKDAFKNSSNKVYIGASAGAMISGESIEEAGSFDRNFVQMSDYKGLCLYDGVIIPHYTKGELKQYIKNSPGIEKKYKKIISVANEKCVVLEV